MAKKKELDSYEIKRIVKDEFTADDLEIAELLPKGFTSPEIGEKLEMSERTVEGKILRMCKLLKAKNRMNLVALIVKNKIDS